jgi:SLT domain-containing protein
MVNKLNAFLDAVNRVKSAASSVGSTIGGGINRGLSAIGFAEGGIVTQPTLAMIGEAGEAEAVIPLSKLGSTMGGLSITITGNTFMSDEDAAETIGDMIISRLKLHNRL